MLLLTSENDLLRITTSSTADIKVHVSYVDNNAGTITPGRTNTNIASATTTTVVASPGAGVQRNIQTILVRNAHASTSNVVTILHTDGTTVSEVFQTTLAAGEVLQYLDSVGFQVYASSGAIKNSINQGTNSTTTTMSTVVLASDVVNNNATANTIADVTDFSFAVTTGNKYWFKFIIPYTSAATTTGSRWSINGPTTTMLNYRSIYSLAATTITTNNATAYNIPAASSATSLTTGNVAIIEGIIIPSADGSVIARFASEIANSAITAKAGAVCYYQQVA